MENNRFSHPDVPGFMWYVPQVYLWLVKLTRSSGMALTSLVQSALPNSSFFTKQSVKFAVPWLVLTCGLNALLTGLITGRILTLARRAKGILPREMTDLYSGMVAILIESALPFTILGIIFAILLGRGLPEDIALAVIWGTFVVCGLKV